MTRFLRVFIRHIGWLERGFLLLSLLLALFIAAVLYGVVAQRPLPSRSPDLYWMVAQTQLALTRVETDVWRYQSGQLSRAALERSYAIAVSKYRMYAQPSPANETLSRVEGFAKVKASMDAFFADKPRRWNLRDAERLSAKLAEFRLQLADFGVRARHQENSDAVEQLGMIDQQHKTMYALGMLCWLAVGVFWFVLHRFGMARQHAQQQRQILEREQSARQAMVQTELARDTFLATISHEIRSPLQSIQTCVELLEFSLPPGKPGYDYLQRLKHSTEHLLAQVRDIMDVAALKNHLLTLEAKNTDVNELIDGIVLAHKSHAEAKGLTLTQACPPLPALLLDGHRLRQIVWNLLSNAIRYTDHGGVSLQVQYLPRELSILVRDSGVGIADDLKPQLFRPFARSKQRRPGSSGLGLAIVHELVTLFGGRILLESEEGVGSCFQVLLPVQEAVCHDAPGRILLLDDDEQIRESYRALLEMNGYRVDTSATVAAAIERVGAKAYDLLLLDLQVGEASGYEVAEAAGQSARNRQTPVIGMTAFRQEFGDQRQALLAGKLEKPFNFVQLQTLLQRCLPDFAGKGRLSP